MLVLLRSCAGRCKVLTGSRCGVANAILLVSKSAVFHTDSEHDAQTGTAQLFESCHPYKNKIKKYYINSI